MDADACNKFATNVRESACGLYPYLSSGISSAIAINLRPISFQDSNAACEGLGAGLGGTFFAASCCASAGSAMKDAAIAIPAIHHNFLIASSVAPLRRGLCLRRTSSREVFFQPRQILLL